jgi:hypothetical protein
VPLYLRLYPLPAKALAAEPDDDDDEAAAGVAAGVAAAAGLSEAGSRRMSLLAPFASIS